MSIKPERASRKAVVVAALLVAVLSLGGGGYVLMKPSPKPKFCQPFAVIGPSLQTKAERLAWFEQQYPDVSPSCHQQYIDTGQE
jgi:hypothetical protein